MNKATFAFTKYRFYTDILFIHIHLCSIIAWESCKTIYLLWMYLNAEAYQEVVFTGLYVQRHWYAKKSAKAKFVYFELRLSLCACISCSFQTANSEISFFRALYRAHVERVVFWLFPLGNPPQCMMESPKYYLCLKLRVAGYHC